MPCRNTIYSDPARTAFSRLLGNLDRFSGSPTSGSFSRDRWLYRFGGRFHPATRQCAAYPIARFHAGVAGFPEFEGNPLLLEALESVLRFTASLQNPDGSFSEWYPRQPSYCATAFLSAYLSEILLISGDRIGAPVRERVETALHLALPFLSSRSAEPGPANQEAAALLAFRNAGMLLGGRVRERAIRMRDRFLACASPEGWFPEHGGADAGYQSLSLDFLARCADRGMDGLEPAVEKGLGFLCHAVLPDGRVPPAHQSRQTNFLMPYAIERWAAEMPAARNLAARIRPALAEGRLPGPATADDRYAAHFFLPSFVDAIPYEAADRPAAPPAERAAAAEAAPSAGLLTLSSPAFTARLQASRGAALLLAPGGRFLWEAPAWCLWIGGAAHLPFEGESAFPGSRETGFDFAAEYRKSAGGGIPGRVAVAAVPALSRFLAAFAPAGAGWMESRLKRAAFSPAGTLPFTFHRRLRLSGNVCSVSDRIEGNAPRGAGRLVPAAGILPSRSPSSGFFTLPDLDAEGSMSAGMREAVADRWARHGRVESTATITLEPSGYRLVRELAGDPPLREETRLACADR